MILDTTAIIDLLRGDKSILKRVESLEKINAPVSTTSISIFELWQGTIDMKDDKKRNKICTLLESIGSLQFDVQSAKEAGLIYSNLRKSGNIIDPEDCMIAGIVKINKETLLTRNKKYFSRIDQLKVEYY